MDFMIIYLNGFILYWFCVVDVATSGIGEARDTWENQRKNFIAEFFEADPCAVSFFYLWI